MAELADTIRDLRYVTAELQTRGLLGLADLVEQATTVLVAEIQRKDEALYRALIAVEITREYVMDVRNNRLVEQWQGQKSAVVLNELDAARAALADARGPAPETKP